MAINRAKSLRKSMTDAERRLWYLLRAHRLDAIKFKRQAVVGRYVVDFVCFERKLVIEVDGGQHDGAKSDIERSRWLTDQGFRVLRFWNNEVLSNTEAVLGQIIDALKPRPGYPSPGTPLRGAPPSPTRERGQQIGELYQCPLLIPFARKFRRSIPKAIPSLERSRSPA